MNEENEEQEEQRRKDFYKIFEWTWDFTVATIILCLLAGCAVITVLMVCGIWRK